MRRPRSLPCRSRRAVRRGVHGDPAARHGGRGRRNAKPAPKVSRSDGLPLDQGAARVVPLRVRRRAIPQQVGDFSADVIERLGQVIGLQRCGDRERTWPATAVEVAANPVGEPFFLAQPGVEPGCELTAQDLVEDHQGIMIGRRAWGPGVPDPDDGLRRARAVHKQDSGPAQTSGVGQGGQSVGGSRPAGKRSFKKREDVGGRLRPRRPRWPRYRAYNACRETAPRCPGSAAAPSLPHRRMRSNTGASSHKRREGRPARRGVLPNRAPPASSRGFARRSGRIRRTGTRG